MHIAGKENTGADGLSQPPMFEHAPAGTINHLFAISNLDRDINHDFPLDMKQIQRAQARCKDLDKKVRQARRNGDVVAHVAIDNTIVTTLNGKVWVPAPLQEQIITWYHNNLQHAGVTRMVNSISQVLGWKGMRPMIEKHVASCDSCQRNKLSNKKAHGKIPLTTALRSKNPWDKVQVDYCGPWTIRYHNEVTGRISSFQIHLLSMFNICNGWPEFTRIDSANSIATAKAFNNTWLCRYPRPLECGYNNGKEFLGIEFQELLESYSIRSKPMTVKNPMANAIVERIQGTLDKQLFSTIFNSDWEDDVDTLIQACAYALRTTAPSNEPYSPAQLTFGCDMLFRQTIIIDWERLKATRTKNAAANNAKENRKQTQHEFKVGDKVLIKLKPYEQRNNPKILPSTYESSPFTILVIYANGNVKLQRVTYTDVINIRRLQIFVLIAYYYHVSENLSIEPSFDDTLI
jgi:hypothetical protein